MLARSSVLRFVIFALPAHSSRQPGSSIVDVELVRRARARAVPLDNRAYRNGHLILQLRDSHVSHSPENTPHGGCLQCIVCFTFAAMTPVLHGGWHCHVAVALSYFLSPFPHQPSVARPPGRPDPRAIPTRYLRGRALLKKNVLVRHI